MTTQGTLKRLEAPTLEATDRQAALLRHREYVAAHKAGRSMPGDDEARAAMHALSRGQAVIDINAVMEHAGCDEEGHNGMSGSPVLAIARADQRRVGFRFFEDGSCGFSSYVDHSYDHRVQRARRHYQFSNGNRSDILKFPDGVLWSDNMGSETYTIEAMVPRIPPPLRPKYRLDRYHILWEAEWGHAPEDPYLLRRIGRSRLFVILAQWNLTETEQALTAALAPPEVEP